MAIFIAFAVSVYLSWLLIRPFLWVITWAVVMCVLFYPIHQQLQRRLTSPGWSAALSTLLVIVTILVPTALVVRSVVGEAQYVAAQAPSTVAKLLSPANPVTGGTVRWIERYQSLDSLRDPHWLEAVAQEWSGNTKGRPLRLVGGVVGIAVQLALIIFTMFYLFRDARLLRTRFYDLVPVENRRIRELFVRTRDVIMACAYGTLLVSVVQGSLGGLAFWVLGLPSPVLWAVVMMLASIIPTLGAFIIWVPAAVYLAATGQAWQAVALTLWGTLVVGLADNVLRPILVRNRTRMHELLVFFGVLGGLELFGVLGLFIGPVIFAIALALVDSLREVGAPEAVGGRAA
jgi:predicted PurR-regulated permease PerM